jgi:predicted transposase YdaD
MKYVTTMERMAEERAKLEEKQQIAMNMLKDDFPLEQISRLTGMPIEEIQVLQAQDLHRIQP